MPKCSICREREAEWAWQPFGPDDNILSFSFLGSHYRSFPVIKVCDECKRTMQIVSPHPGVHSSFTYKHRLYAIDNGKLAQFDGTTGKWNPI